MILSTNAATLNDMSSTELDALIAKAQASKAVATIRERDAEIAKEAQKCADEKAEKEKHTIRFTSFSTQYVFNTKTNVLEKDGGRDFGMKPSVYAKEIKALLDRFYHAPARKNIADILTAIAAASQ